MQKQSDSALLQEKTLVDYCDDWLAQYHDAYDVMNRICSSSKGNRYSLSMATSVNLEHDERGDFYSFHLDMFNGAGDLFLSGPYLEMNADNIEEVSYLVSSMMAFHMKEQKCRFSSPFSGKDIVLKPRLLESYRPALVSLDVSDCLLNPYISQVVANQVYYGNGDNFDDLLVLYNRFTAETQDHVLDQRFIDSLNNSSEHTSNVLSFGNVQKR